MPRGHRMSYSSRRIAYIDFSPEQVKFLIQFLELGCPLPGQGRIYAEILYKLHRPASSGELCRMNPPGPRHDAAIAERMQESEDTQPSMVVFDSDDKTMPL